MYIFAVNDLPNFGEWMKTNEQQFRKPHRHDGPNQYMDKHMMDRNNHMMPQDSMGHGTNTIMVSKYCTSNGQMPHSKGQMPRHMLCKASHLNNLMAMYHNKRTVQGAPETTQN